MMLGGVKKRVAVPENGRSSVCLRVGYHLELLRGDRLVEGRALLLHPQCILQALLCGPAFGPVSHWTTVSPEVHGALLPQASSSDVRVLLRAAGAVSKARRGFSLDTQWEPKTSSATVVRENFRLSVISPSSI